MVGEQLRRIHREDRQNGDRDARETGERADELPYRITGRRVDDRKSELLQNLVPLGIGLDAGMNTAGDERIQTVAKIPDFSQVRRFALISCVLSSRSRFEILPHHHRKREMPGLYAFKLVPVIVKE